MAATVDLDAITHRTFGPKYERLVAIKGRYDRTNMFRFNQNIKPPPAGVATTRRELSTD